MKPKDTAALIKSLRERGYVEHDGKFYPPRQAAELGITPAKPARRKPGTAPRHSHKVDAFCMFVKQQIDVDLVTEYRFDDVRKWRFDYACPALMLAIEQEGGVFSGGRHTRAVGYIGDMEKYSAAAAQGWIVLRFLPQEMLTSKTVDLIRKVIQNGRTLEANLRL